MFSTIKLDKHIREMIAFGVKGAALAAFGEIEAGFFALLLAPFGDRKDGVKLGESTLNDFLELLQFLRQHHAGVVLIQFTDLSC